MILITIGTRASNKLVYDRNNPKHKYISGDHAELLLLLDGSIYLTDKGSTNGTKVNGKKIEPEVEVSIKRSDKIVFADAAELDWSMIPVVPPIDPQEWDVYSIGSDFRNRVKVSDMSNTVSRFHAIMKVNKKSGKVYITDYSSNGTFVGGNKITSRQEVQVKRWGEQIMLSNMPLNWNVIKRPIRFQNLLKYIAAIAAILIVGVGAWHWEEIHDFIIDDGGGNKMKKISAKYSSAVVCIYHEYGIYADVILGNGSLRTFGVVISNSAMPAERVAGYLTPDLSKEDNEENSSFIYLADVDNSDTKYNGLGTAFFVDQKGTLMTNRHITIPWEQKLKLCGEIEKRKDIHVKRIYGKTIYVGFTNNGQHINNFYRDFNECIILSENSGDEQKDVGLMRTKNTQLPSHVTNYIDISKAMINQQSLSIGSDIFILGYPLGVKMFALAGDGSATNAIEVKLTSQQGQITQSPDRYKFGHNAATYGGTSGSPIFNSKGQLIGIHSAGLSQSGIGGFGWGILAKHASELYDNGSY